ncbi:MAG: PEP-CTERM sorting domain-containing protein [Zoogloea sp.]|nr:PEP-CTERM sorting domain-containing protein [Zoogloea sp.]
MMNRLLASMIGAIALAASTQAIAAVAIITPPSGSTPSDPLMPISGEGAPASGFAFVVPGAPGWWFIDPLVATGYNYAVSTAGVSFAGVQVSTNAGDGLYNLYDTTGGGEVLLSTTLATGAQFTFGSAVTSFRITGIETSAALDPADPLAFVTGISFSFAGTPPAGVSVSQSPIITDTGSAVPEPATAALTALGLAGLGALRRRA